MLIYARCIPDDHHGRGIVTSHFIYLVAFPRKKLQRGLCNFVFSISLYLSSLSANFFYEYISERSGENYNWKLRRA